MSYISAIRSGDDVVVWERNNSTDGRTVRTYKAPYNFFIEDSDGEYTSIFGKKLTKLEFANSRDMSFAKRDYITKGIQLYESDISPELKVLSANYYNTPTPALNITMIDIEVDYDKERGFSSVDNPYAEINAISFYHKWKNKMVSFAIPPKDGVWFDEHGMEWDIDWFGDQLDSISPPEAPYTLEFFRTERELLKRLIVEIEDSDIICGWNSDFFDTPYVAKRIELVLGNKYFRKLSFPGAPPPKYREVEVFGNPNITVELMGRISADYLPLFKKYEMNGRPSYKLETIADAICPELPKLKYEGTLADLYRNDFPMFVRYNIRDVEILKGFEDKLGYVALANEMYHISTGDFKHVNGTLKLAELAIINHCHYNLNLRVKDTVRSEEGGSIQGALVLTPKSGMHDLLGSIDIKSLYPSAIQALNISPEMLIGQFTDTSTATTEISNNSDVKLTLEFDSTIPDNGMELGDRVIEASAKEWREFFIEQKWAVSGYGTVFSQTKLGIIPSILQDWYSTRKSFQSKQRSAINSEGDKSNTKGLSEYYDRLQYVYKIKLNSLYGALSNKFFRFYDLRMGESTTSCGRLILNHQCAKVNEILTGEYDMSGEAIIYGDTDSVVGTTKINTNVGEMSIETLFAACDRVISIAHCGDKGITSIQSLSYDIGTKQPYYENIHHVHRHKVSKGKWLVESEGNSTITITNDHSVMVERSGNVIEVKPSEINTTSDVLIELTHNENDNSYSSMRTKILHVSQLSDFDNEYVYDISIDHPTNQWFFGNKILVHNSTYFKTFADTEDAAVKIADFVGRKVTESYQQFMRDTFLCGPEFDQKIQADREVVASRGIFIDKKRYILNVIDNEGEKCDKLKTMGVELKKTTMPAAISKQLSLYIERLLKGESWKSISPDIVDYKEELTNTQDIMAIGLPTGVQKVEQYTKILGELGSAAKLPGHISAALFYNLCLDEFGDKESMRITSGMKIKVFYLNKPHGRFKSIAIPTDCEIVPEWFLRNFKIDRDRHITRLIDNPLNNIVKAIGDISPTKQALFVDSILVF